MPRKSVTDATPAIVMLVAISLIAVAMLWLVLRAADASLRSAEVSGEVPAIERWSDAQIENAAIIVKAGEDLGFGERDRTIAVMTAMGESSLRVLDYGDEAGPDSRGLFQQRDAWGPLDVRMNAYGSAVLFYRALGKVADREATQPTLVAHAVQINADPLHYAPYWDDAVAIVESLDDAAVDVEVR